MITSLLQVFDIKFSYFKYLLQVKCVTLTVVQEKWRAITSDYPIINKSEVFCSNHV